MVPTQAARQMNTKQPNTARHSASRGCRHAHHKGHMPYQVGENVAAREPKSPQMPKPKAKQQRQTAPACHSMHNRKKKVRGNLHTASCNQATTVQRGLPRRVFSSGAAKSGPIGRTDKGCQQRSNIAQQLNSGSRKTRRSSITRQGRNNWQRQRNTQITQDGRNLRRMQD